MKRTYNKTEHRRSFFKEMFEKLDGRCMICGEKERLVIDHNHATGEFRGLLCYSHNAGLGMFQDSPELLERAAKYLLTYPSEIALVPFDKRLIPEDQNTAMLNILADNSYSSDRARARALVSKLGLSEGCWQTRISRIQRKMPHDVKNP